MQPSSRRQEVACQPIITWTLPVCLFDPKPDVLPFLPHYTRFLPSHHHAGGRCSQAAGAGGGRPL